MSRRSGRRRSRRRRRWCRAASSGLRAAQGGRAGSDDDIRRSGRQEAHARPTSHGKAVVLTFIYTRCPMPTFCPLMDRNFVALQDADEGRPGPERAPGDRELRSGHRHAAGAQEARAEARRPTRSSGPSSRAIATTSTSSPRASACRWRARDTTSATSRTTCGRPSSIGSGNLVKIYTGNEWTPADVMADIKILVGVD